MRKFLYMKHKIKYEYGYILKRVRIDTRSYVYLLLADYQAFRFLAIDRTFSNYDDVFKFLSNK